MAKYDIKQRALQDLPDFDLRKKKFQEDVATAINWKPTFSRIKILPDPERMSGVVDTPDGWRQSLTRGTIVALGPDVGKRDGIEVEKFWVGQRVLYLTAHVMTYAGADGVMHHFLKENADVNSIIAIEPVAKEATSADAMASHFTNIQQNLDKTSALAKSLNGKG
jgi:hypothetical protein